MAFEAHEATVSTVQEALRSGTSCQQIVEAFLARIEALNPQVNAIICLNPSALQEARMLDERLARAESPGILCGVPVLLKDNFDAIGMPTTAGSLALRDVWPNGDADVVKALREAGAVILGKTNLHEFALEGLTVSSLGGQTLNPYDFSRTPGGSSGGSGAAVASSFAVMATGTDTVNSLRSPASANSLFSFRPTQGLISRKGIIPAGSTQDAMGMIGRCLKDIAIAMVVMSSTQEQGSFSSAQARCTITGVKDFIQDSSVSDSQKLAPLRIGVLHGFFDYTTSPETTPVNEAIRHVRSALKEEEMIFVDILEDPTFNAPAILATTDVQMYEVRDLLDAYLTSPSLRGTHPLSYREIFTWNSGSDFLVIPLQSSFIHTALISSTSSADYVERKEHITNLRNHLAETFHASRLDAIIYPAQRNLVVSIGSPNQYGRNGILAAVTGYPVICMPVGFSPPTESAPVGLPIGMEILGLPWSEAKLLQIAGKFDQKLNARKPPVTGGFAKQVVTGVPYHSVPIVRPHGLSSVDTQAYPVGRY